MQDELKPPLSASCDSPQAQKLLQCADEAEIHKYLDKLAHTEVDLRGLLKVKDKENQRIAESYKKLAKHKSHTNFTPMNRRGRSMLLVLFVGAVISVICFVFSESISTFFKKNFTAASTYLDSLQADITAYAFPWWGIALLCGVGVVLLIATTRKDIKGYKTGARIVLIPLCALVVMWLCVPDFALMISSIDISNTWILYKFFPWWVFFSILPVLLAYIAYHALNRFKKTVDIIGKIKTHIEESRRAKSRLATICIGIVAYSILLSYVTVFILDCLLMLLSVMLFNTFIVQCVSYGLIGGITFLYTRLQYYKFRAIYNRLERRL